ncbi:MAG: S49 family peptidase [Desulfobacterium sp.]|nr:S49 family peptidase [Desulfobacterium sp.]
MKPNFKFNLKPLMLAETATSALLNGNLDAAVIKRAAAPGATTPSSASTQAGVITIRGAMFPSTYQRLDYMLDLMAAECGAIVLDINSPGGMVAGCFDLSDKIYLLRQKVPIYTIVGESCYSAAYCLASASTKIFLARSAGVGSIGVIAVHVDQSGFDERMGVKYTPVYAGTKKNDCSPHAALSPRAMADLKESIDDSYETFCQTVARNRGILAANVKQTEAGIFYGQGAIEAGLVDVIASRKDAFQSIALDLSKSTGPKASATTPKAAASKTPMLDSIASSTPKTKAQNPNALVEDAKKRAQAAVLKAFDKVAKTNTPTDTKAVPTLSIRIPTGTSYLH